MAKNEITNPSNEEENIRRGLEAYQTIKSRCAALENEILEIRTRHEDEVSKLQANAQGWESHALLNQREAETLRNQVTDLQSRLEFYMRYGANLASHATAIRDHADKMLAESKQASYKDPNGPRPNARQLGRDVSVDGAGMQGGDNGEPAPKFLTQPFLRDEDLEEPK